MAADLSSCRAVSVMHCAAGFPAFDRKLMGFVVLTSVAGCHADAADVATKSCRVVHWCGVACAAGVLT